MARWLSAEWVAYAVQLGKGTVALPGIEGTFDSVVSGGPDGEVTARWIVAAGEVAAAGVAGRSPELDWSRPADVQWSLSAEDAYAWLEGTLDPAVAFMRGRLKTVGAPGLVLDVLAATATDACAAWRRQVAQLTEPLPAEPLPAESSG